MLKLFRLRPTSSDIGRELSQIGHREREMRRRARVDEMRAAQGKSPWNWRPL